MVNIGRKCLDDLLLMGMVLGPLPGMLEDYPPELVDHAMILVESNANAILTNCPHPPNVASDEAPPRKFVHELRRLRTGWKDQSLDASLDQWDELMRHMNAWLDGMAYRKPRATPSARKHDLVRVSNG